MTTLQHIQFEIEQLSLQDIAYLSKWIADLNFARWDKQIEEDDRTGKLDQLMTKVLADIASGKTQEL